MVGAVYSMSKYSVSLLLCLCFLLKARESSEEGNNGFHTIGHDQNSQCSGRLYLIS